MDKETEEIEAIELVGESGSLYLAIGTPVYSGIHFGELYAVFGDENVAALLLPDDCLSEEHAGRARRMIARNASLYGEIALQISCPLELLYRDGAFAGLLVSYMAAGSSLPEILNQGPVDSVFRTRAACNLCSVVLLSGRVGTTLGRLDPYRILIDERSGRVFVVPNLLSALEADAYGEEGALDLRGRSLESEPVDLAFHIYALQHGRQCATLENAIWNEYRSLGSGPSANLISSALLESLRKPLLIRALDLLPFTDAFEGPFWSDPPALRKLYERSFLGRSSSQISQVALGYYVALERPRSAAAGRLSLLIEGVKRLASGGGISRDELKENERKISGSRSSTQPCVFWLTTLGCSAAMGLYAMLNGFTPIDLAWDPAMDARLPESAEGVKWQFVPAAVAGSAVFNLALARRNRFVGYGKGAYCWSVLAAVLFMFLTRLAFGSDGGLLQ